MLSTKIILGNVTRNKSVVTNTATEVKVGSALNCLANMALVEPDGAAANMVHKEITVSFIPNQLSIKARVKGIINNLKKAITPIFQSNKLFIEFISAIKEPINIMDIGVVMSPVISNALSRIEGILIFNINIIIVAAETIVPIFNSFLKSMDPSLLIINIPYVHKNILNIKFATVAYNTPIDPKIALAMGKPMKPTLAKVSRLM